MQKKGPAILIIVLIIILVFILGVRYGQRVEKTNKSVSALLSIPPTKPQPTQAPVTFKTYSGKACGAQFLYPSTLSVQKEGSNAAVLGKDKKNMVSFSCEKNNPFATKSGELLLKKNNPLNGRTVFFVISQELSPLLEISLKFVNQ